MTQPPKKSHWSSRAKIGLDKTLDFIKEYAPKIIKAGAMLTILGFAGSQAVAFAMPDASLAHQIAGGVASSFLQLKEMYEQLTESLKNIDYDDATETESEDVEQLREQLDEARDIIRGLSASNTEQQTIIATMSRALETVNTSHNTLMNSHTDMRDALSQAQNELLDRARARGEIIDVPFDSNNQSLVRLDESHQHTDNKAMAALNDEYDDVGPTP